MKHLQKWRAKFATIDLKYATLTIQDGTPTTPLNVELTFGDGNFTWSEKRNVEYRLDRGLLDDVREGDQIPCEVSFEGRLEYYSGTGGVPTANEALTKTGEASAWVSTDSDPCRPYAVDLVLLYRPTNCAASNQETITFADFRQESLDYDVQAGTISVSGKCNVVRPTAVRAAQP